MIPTTLQRIFYFPLVGLSGGTVTLAAFSRVWPSWEDLRVASTLRFAIEAAFRRAKIEIPFPQRVVHLSPEVRRAG
jgi:small-conductance mechanosensitive channel